MFNPYVLLMIVSVVLASFSQILLKKSSMRTYSSPIREYLNLYVIVGYGMLFLSLFMTMVAYKGFENFANVPLLESLGYAVVMILGYFFFKEKITVNKVLGIALILGGIFIYNVV
ncbi:MAG: multidrug ABC transporter [Lachnospiraceae bacterium]|nr:multidrug ABC transporter [Lachnospiraceae bacterium]